MIGKTRGHSTLTKGFEQGRPWDATNVTPTGYVCYYLNRASEEGPQHFPGRCFNQRQVLPRDQCFLDRLLTKRSNEDRLNSLGLKVVIARTEFADILSQAANWPAEDRVVLAWKILETVGETPRRRSSGRSAEEII